MSQWMISLTATTCKPNKSWHYGAHTFGLRQWKEETLILSIALIPPWVPDFHQVFTLWTIIYSVFSFALVIFNIQRYWNLNQSDASLTVSGQLYVVIIIIIITIIIIVVVISFMQGIYTYILETSSIPRGYSVAAILLLLFLVLISLAPVLNLLYFYIGTFRSMCAVPNIAVFFIVPWLHVFLVCCSRIF